MPINYFLVTFTLPFALWYRVKTHSRTVYSLFWKRCCTETAVSYVPEYREGLVRDVEVFL